MECDPAAQRVAEDERLTDAERVADTTDEIGELREPRVLFAQRGREPEPRQVDEVRPIAEGTQEPDLRRELRCGGAHTWQDERIGSVGGAASPDSDPVATSFDDGVAHEARV